jgi:putative phosphoribosyl transferase
MRFRDRAEAGRRLAEALAPLRQEHPVVLGLPRGGVPVAFEVARALGAPLDVIVVRKLGLPFQPELAMGAIGEGGIRILNLELIRAAGLSEVELAAVARREEAELERRVRRFRGERPPLVLDGRAVVVVDDGIATGSTARAACQVARAHGATSVILAVPVAARSSIENLEDVTDEIVCLTTPEPFFAVGQWYDDFDQVSDETVSGLLQGATAASTSDPDSDPDDPPVREEDVAIPVGEVKLAGHLTVPENCRGLIVFAHGSGSSRHSPRNRFVAEQLNEASLGTLLVDLLTVDEELDRANVFDVELLAQRLVAITSWLSAQPEVASLRIGYFGASTGAAAALRAAAEPGNEVAAVVSRGGRPDLAGRWLASVRAPTLLVVGGHDDVVLELNRHARRALQCTTELAIVPGATHLFEESGALEEVARLACWWFCRHLPR